HAGSEHAGGGGQGQGLRDAQRDGGRRGEAYEDPRAPGASNRRSQGRGAVQGGARGEGRRATVPAERRERRRDGGEARGDGRSEGQADERSKAGRRGPHDV